MCKASPVEKATPQTSHLKELGRFWSVLNGISLDDLPLFPFTRTSLELLADLERSRDLDSLAWSCVLVLDL